MIYLDNAATTKPYYESGMSEIWFNLNSSYAYYENKMKENADDMIKEVLGVKTGTLVYGYSATQIIYTILNELRCTVDPMILVSEYEHDCVYKFKNTRPCKTESEMAERTNGLQTDSVLACWMYANNIVGNKFEVEKLGSVVRQNDKFFICDLTAAIGKDKIVDLEDWCDVAFWSGHKFGCEKGIGGAWISDRFVEHWYPVFKDIDKFFKGVNGTFDLSRYYDMASLMWMLNEQIDKALEHYETLNNWLNFHVAHSGGWIIKDVNRPSLNATNAVFFPDIVADVFCTWTANTKSIYVSPGHSACEENNDYRVLVKGYGMDEKAAQHVIRVSFGPDNTIQDIEDLCSAVNEFREVFLS